MAADVDGFEAKVKERIQTLAINAHAGRFRFLRFPALPRIARALSMT